MTSILTNAAAMAALQTLRAIDRNMETTQARVSSGLRVETAADNAAYWSIATTMRSDNSALSTVQDALGLGAAKVDTAYAAMESAIETVTEIKTKLVAAYGVGANRGKIQEEIAQLQEQLKSIAESATFSGENWLQDKISIPATPPATGVIEAPVIKQVVASFTRTATGEVTVQTVDYSLDSKTVLFDLSGGKLGILDKEAKLTPTSTATLGFSVFTLDITKLSNVATTMNGEQAGSAPTDEAVLDMMARFVDGQLLAMTSAASSLGSIQSRIDLQEDFIASLIDVIDKGVGRLVDADMNEESTRLKALQTQQQLGIQSLSIANTNAENILQLFRQ
ncbi:flagellin [Rhizobium sp. LC145]|uniref:flagellin N-terminal helical domain-containing protein n=1 Tax=Rhizobium sp. LC145 TaxID=1120688 RepID=UPI00062A0688|nr:flagellin [Rhizobium sp. LC145]KKX23681.1 flagellin [Rhizobium sp. LC145]TKT58975.1 flagellin [Rhizobiaceae bacterium LC148]